MENTLYRLGPTNFSRMSDSAASKANSVDFSSFLKTLRSVSPGTADQANSLVSLLEPALNNQLPLSIVTALQLANEEFPDIYKAVSVLLIMRRESGFNPLAVNLESGAFGILQLLQSTAKGLHNQEDSYKIINQRIQPVTHFFRLVNPVEGNRLVSGTTTVPLSADHPFDQVQYAAQLYVYNSSVVRNLFKFDLSTNRWALTSTGIKRVINEPFLKFFNSDPLWNNEPVGRHMLMYSLHLHGSGGFLENKPLRYFNDTENALRVSGTEMALFIPTIDIHEAADQFVTNLSINLLDMIGTQFKTIIQL